MIDYPKRMLGITTIVAALLCIPLVVMQFSDEVNWGAADFLVMGLMLFGVGLAIELVLRLVPKAKHRVLLCAGIIVLFLLIWAELAVGILGTSFGGS